MLVEYVNIGLDLILVNLKQLLHDVEIVENIVKLVL